MSNVICSPTPAPASGMDRIYDPNQTLAKERSKTSDCLEASERNQEKKHFMGGYSSFPCGPDSLE